MLESGMSPEDTIKFYMLIHEHNRCIDTTIKVFDDMCSLLLKYELHDQAAQILQVKDMIEKAKKEFIK